MQSDRKVESQTCNAPLARMLTSATAFALAAVVLSPVASAELGERTGKEVVETVCASCHEKGLNGAPKIGDKKAWAVRASQGLTALSAHALNGIRKMPAHGGSASLSDFEVTRAITYMVNRSGGHWVEPLGETTPAVVRRGEEIVQKQCSKCHQTGLNGAPKIGDRAAWIPRMSRGLDVLVKSAVHGHGAMPARGGIADLTDREIEGAIVHMFNYGVVMVETPPRAAPAAADPYHKVIAGTEIYLGVVKAEAMPAGQRPASVASGKGYYHVNISLIDVETKVAIKGAQVRVKVADSFSAETKALEATSVNDAISYGGYFRMAGNSTYTITAQIERPSVAGVTEAKFVYKAW
jgi:cytochrome c5